jgi:hypothetical protein
MKRLLMTAIFLLLHVHIAYATATCSAVIHINGINTDRGDARENKKSLKEQVGNTHNNKRLKYVLAYNPTKGFLSDLADVIEAKHNEYPEVTEAEMIRFYLLAKNEEVNQTDLDIETVTKFYVDQIESKGYVNLDDSDFESILTEINGAVAKDENILLLPHSQGGLYANSVYARLLSGSDSRGADNVSIYAVATAASFVAGEGRYLTSHKDLVIWGLSLIRPVLESNHPVSFTFGDFLGHGFREIYLNFDLEARDAIVHGIYKELEAFPTCSACAFEVAVNDAEATCYESDTFKTIGYTGSSSFPYESYTFHINYDDVITSWTACRHCTEGWTNSSGDRLEIGNGAGGQWVHGGINLSVNIID